MPKVVINTCHGGFNLSRDAMHEIGRRKNWAVAEVHHNDHFQSVHWLPEHPYDHVHTVYTKWVDGLISERDLDRDDADLVAVVEANPTQSAGKYAELAIVKVPDDVEWYITEYDGAEWVAEKHRTWS